MPYPNIDTKEAIRSQAVSLGFDACGFAEAAPVDDVAVARYDKWIELGHNGCMLWAARNRDLRRDPSMLLQGAQTVIALALNYYPARFQPREALQVAYYAYGCDYHKVLREKLTRLAHFIKEITQCDTRPCVDSAPMRERYWAQRAGIGFVGRNNCLILPGKGSYFFLGEILTTARLTPDDPCQLTCGDCGKCLAACPTGALAENGGADASRCLSCLLIENHDEELPEWVTDVVGDRIVGCDECQRCCPHNAQARATNVEEFYPTDAVMTLTRDRIREMTPGEFKRTFANSAISRLRYKTLRRNASLKLPVEDVAQQPPEQNDGKEEPDERR